MSDKIQRRHLERKAILYVRQSSAHQVLHNRESGALQYAMRDRLLGLGFTRIETIDDDLGRSASGSAERAGFDRMVAQVCLGRIGAVAAREVSRFARNSRDWQQLIEMCRVVDTVLVHWAGGVHAELRLPRRRRGQRNSAPLETVEAIRRLALIAHDNVIAGVLNRNGLRTGNGNRWTRTRLRVARLPQDPRVPPGSGRRRALAQSRQRVRAAQSDTRCSIFAAIRSAQKRPVGDLPAATLLRPDWARCALTDSTSAKGASAVGRRGATPARTPTTRATARDPSPAARGGR